MGEGKNKGCGVWGVLGKCRGKKKPREKRMCVKVEEEEGEKAEEGMAMVSGVVGRRKDSADGGAEREALKKDDGVIEAKSIDCVEEKKKNDEVDKCQSKEVDVVKLEDDLPEEPNGSPVFLKCNVNSRKSVSESLKDDVKNHEEGERTSEEEYKVEDSTDKNDELPNNETEESDGSPVFLKCKVKIQVEIEDDSRQKTDDNGNIIDDVTVEEKEDGLNDDHVMIFHMEDVHEDETKETVVEENPIFLKCNVKKRPSESSQGAPERVIADEETEDEGGIHLDVEYFQNNEEVFITREASSSSTQSQSTPSTPLGGDSPETPLPPPTPVTSESTSTPTSTSTSSGAKGVWSPGATPETQRKEFNFTPVKEELSTEAAEDAEPVAPVWTPRSAQASPTSERKFRPVNFESPKLARKSYNKPSEEPPKPPTDLPLQLDSPSHSQSSSVSSSSQQYLSSTQTVTTHSTQSTQETSGRLVTSHSLPDTSLPRAQNPTITLLQKAREGQLPRGAHYLEQNSNSVTVNSNSVERRSSPPAVRPTDILYSTRREYENESEDKQPKKFVELSPKKVSGIGPTTKEGIPIVLRSEVQDENQQRWYKRMYDSLHRAERDSRYPYTSSAGYLSEPEPVGSYDSDYSNSKYATLDRRRIKHTNHNNEYSTSTMPRSNKYNAVKHAVDVYKNQPGRIEDYEPGHSSIADKEAKQWWDEVMDIFDGQFEQTQKSSPRTHAPATTGTNKPFMTYALKESGYESDSTLVFKRRDETQQQLSPAEQKQAYKVIQKGGDVPLHGLRKPVPDKPKEPLRGTHAVPQRGPYPPQRRPESPHRYVESEVTIHYRSPVRTEEKEAWSEEELQRRQAEAMRRIYQEERRRKYLQELQDMYSRRHTDNFTPSQKSPIPLNRYDDFLDDLSPGKPRDRTPEPKLVARALYNFVGQTSRELTFRRGDIIYVRRQIDKNWYEGEHNAMIGLFPLNYVEIIPYDGIRTIPKRPTEGQARAKFNFQAQTHLELPLVKGELVLLTRRVDNNWFEGRIGNRKGIFPCSYVEVLVEPGERTVSPVRVQTPTKPVASPASHSLHMNSNMSQHHYQPPRPVSYTSLPRQKTADLKQAPVNQTLHIDTQSEPVPYRVLYNYKPQNEDELELVEGETVYVMEKCDDGWYVGSSQHTGYLGTFPGNYVQRV